MPMMAGTEKSRRSLPMPWFSSLSDREVGIVRLSVKQPADRFVAVDSLDRLAQQRRYRQNVDLRDAAAGRQGNRVRDDQLLDRRLVDSFDRAAAKDAVRRGQEYFPRPGRMAHLRRAANRSGRGDHVVKNQRPLVVDRPADQIGLLR